MSAASLDKAEALRTSAVEQLFADATAADVPTFRVMLGRGANSIGVRLDAETLRELSAQQSSESGVDEAAALLSAALSYARGQRLSTSVQLPAISSRALTAAVHQFERAGFRAELALSEISGEEAVLRDVVAALDPTRRMERISLPRAREEASARVRLARESVELNLVDCLIVTRGGELTSIELDSSDESRGAARDLLDASSMWSTLRTARWLSELRAATARAGTAKSVDVDVLRALYELHTFALEVAVPALRLPNLSEARDTQRQILRDRQLTLRSMLRTDASDGASLVISPVVTSSARLDR